MEDILNQIEQELEFAINKFPTWPTDLIHAYSIIGEECGELNKSVLQITYEPNKGVTLDDVRSEAIQTAAMAIRFIVSLDAGLYTHTAGKQHEQ